MVWARWGEPRFTITDAGGRPPLFLRCGLGAGWGGDGGGGRAECAVRRAERRERRERSAVSKTRTALPNGHIAGGNWVWQQGVAPHHTLALFGTRFDPQNIRRQHRLTPQVHLQPTHWTFTPQCSSKHRQITAFWSCRDLFSHYAIKEPGNNEHLHPKMITYRCINA